MATSALFLALAAGVYPLGLAIVLRYLGEPPSMRHAFAYLAGTASITLGAGVAILVTLRGSGLTERSRPTPSGGIEVFLGVALLYVAFRLNRRPRSATRDGPGRPDASVRPHEPERTDGIGHPDGPEHPDEPRKVPEGIRNSTRRVFLLGLITYLPSLLYVSAIKNIADAHMSNATSALLLVLCAVLVLQMVEIPIILRLVAPRRTGAILASYNSWMHRHGRSIVIILAVAGGIYLLLTGVMTLLD
ncbi:GAP family protein [Protofrankia symbiont of Coriaria ruscifolia]|uniref:GAP family protein n=1 Tax=Protofrankia symbiont of Coriaria ruscifolia TaxID=1306542 RepID=UPI00104166CF|nr:GAP family protein [Protofrankia symbiont of Coriaria ruscifolia]